MSELLLKDYRPESELVVPRTAITKPKFPVIDIHGHFGPMVFGEAYEDRYDTGEVLRRLGEYGVKAVTNLELLWGRGLERMLEKTKDDQEQIPTFSSVDVRRFEDSDFPRYVQDTITHAVDRGVKGLKFWKNISLRMKDSHGRYIRMDDPRLAPIWNTAAAHGLPVLVHIGDPVAFFRPITPENERYEELQAHPDWSFCHPELPSFQQLLEMQEAMIKGHPDTTFIVAHGGSYAENLRCLSGMLDRLPNMYIDIAARINEFGRQPYSARAFFQQYQDRILFGTDFTPESFGYIPYYRFLETFDEYFPYDESDPPGQGRWNIYGIGLEDPVLKKVYWNNSAGLLGFDPIA